MTAPATCPACGAAAEGNFCSRCGAALAAESSPAACAACGAKLKSGALYCSECGAAVAAPAPKPASARLPWLLSAALLAAFSVIIALWVQRNAAPRIGDQVMTGGIDDGSSAAGAAAGGAAPMGGAPADCVASGSMPGMQELASMTPRQMSDRLFERVMREHEGGGFECAAFFTNMGLQAYAAVPEAEMDADGRFHVGLLQLVQGDSASARRTAEEILDEEPDHLLGLVLAGRAATFAGDTAAARERRERVREIVREAGGIPERVEYVSHRPIIERALADPAGDEGGTP